MVTWKLKAHTLAVLSRVPGGHRLYHALQAHASARKQDGDEYLGRALEVLQMLQENGANLRGAKYLEIGTGWRPFLPFLLSLAGAADITTFDVNRWLNGAYAFRTLREIAERLATVAEGIGLDSAELRRRLDAVGGATDWRSLLRLLQIDYRCPADARQTGLPGASIDSVCSTNVLGHIPPDVLAGIHRETFRVLKPGGLAVHRLNIDDHFSYVDPSIARVNFLRFSERQWHWYGGTGLGYHNRLRAPQHRRLLADAGFQIVSERVRVDSHALEAIRTGALPIHRDFAQFQPEELAGVYMWVVCRRPG